MTMRTNESKGERELRDPMLTALLQDAYSDDPALAEAPGRTEMIMRRLLAAGVQPKPSPWRVWGWAVGFAATAAVVLVFAMVLLHAPKPQQWANNNNPPQPVAPRHQPAPAPHDERPQLAKEPTFNAPRERGHDAWNPRATVNTFGAEPRAPRPAPEPRRQPSPPITSTVVASALYTTGETAHAAGDFATAYEAYSASYEAAPNPQTLLAASDALLRMDGEDGGS